MMHNRILSFLTRSTSTQPTDRGRPATSPKSVPSSRIKTPPPQRDVSVRDFQSLAANPEPFTIDPHPDRPHPTLADPAVVIARDGALFICWVEELADGLRWAFVSQYRVHYSGPAYAGEDTIERIHEVVGDWWEVTKLVGSQDDNM